MTIKNMLMSNIAASADFRSHTANVLQKPEKSDRFDKFMREVEKIETPRQSEMDKLVSKDNRKKAENLETETHTSEVRDKSAQKAEKSDSEKPVENIKENQDTKSVEDEAAELEREIISKLAAELGISPDKLLEILNSLQIKAYELVEPEKMNLLVQELTGAKDIEARLTMPEFKETLVKLNGAMSEFEDAAKEIAVKLEGLGPKPVVQEQAQKSLVEQKTEQAFDLAQSQQGAEPKVEQKTAEARQSSQNNSGTNNGGEQTAKKQELPAAENTVAPRAEFNAALDTTQTQSIVKTEAVAQAAKSVNTQDIIDQIVSKIKVDVRTDVTQVKMTLKPESLGEVQMKIISQNGIITAQFIAENQRVKEAIEAGFSDLKDMLNQQGVNIEQLSVSVGNSEADEQAEHFLNEGRQRFGRIRQADSNESENALPEQSEQDALYQGSVSIRA